MAFCQTGFVTQSACLGFRGRDADAIARAAEAAVVGIAAATFLIASVHEVRLVKRPQLIATVACADVSKPLRTADLEQPGRDRQLTAPGQVTELVDR